jgi:predicted permease
MFDLRYAVLSLVRSRWFTAGAVLTYALGIGANLVVFAAVDQMLFRPLPYTRPAELVSIVPSSGDRIYTRTPRPIVTDALAATDVFQAVAVTGQANRFVIDPANEDDSIRLTEATYQLLDVLGVRPVLGRNFVRDDAIAKARVALIRNETWQQRFAARGDIIGRHVGSGSNAYEIVGVLPAGFQAPTMFLGATDGLRLDPDVLDPGQLKDAVWPAIARLRPGVTIASAQAALDTIASRTSTALGAPANRPIQVRALPIQDAMFYGYRTYLWLVVGAAAMVLLIACANLASLLLVRGRTREQATALAVALGASRARLVRTALFECLVVATAGGVVAVLILSALGRTVTALLPDALRQYTASVGDLRVLGVAAIAVLASALAAGVLPVLRAARVDLQATLQLGTKSGRRTSVASSWGLLVVESAFGMLLVAGAILTGRSLIGLLDRELGFDPAGLALVDATIPFSEPTATRAAFYGYARTVIAEQPEVASAAGVDVFTIGGTAGMRAFPSPDRVTDGALYQITGRYFDTIGTRVLAGRAITDDDGAAHAPVAVISERGARLLWPDESPSAVIGRVVRVPNEIDRTIVGVVEDQRATSATAPGAALFVPFGQADPKMANRVMQMQFVVRQRAGMSLSAGPLRARLRAQYPSATVKIVDAESQLAPALQQPKLQAWLFGSFAMIALVLAGVGLFAVSSLDVTERRYEMGVRLALGASPGRLHWGVVAGSIVPVAAGVGIGLVAAWWASSFLQAFLVDVRAHNPVWLALASLTLVLTGMGAAWLPARRAARTDPAVVLRAQ